MKLSEQVTDLQRRLSEQARKIARLERERRALLQQHLTDAHQAIEAALSAGRAS